MQFLINIIYKILVFDELIKFNHSLIDGCFGMILIYIELIDCSGIELG